MTREELLKLLQKAKNMKAVPEGRIAKELWQGAIRNIPEISEEVLTVLNECYEQGVIPKRWQVSQTVQLDKANGKSGTKAVRLINLLCPMGNLLFRKIWSQTKGNKYPFAYGFYEGRRREQAILVQQ
jgi:hypothetical protein